MVGTFTDQMCSLAAWLNARLNGDADTDSLWGRKDIQRQRLRAAGLSGVMSNRVSDGFALREFARQAGFPVVVKPTNGCGSNEVWLLRQEADVDAFLARSGTGPRQELDDVFAEQFIVGEPWAGPCRADYVSAELFRPARDTEAAALRFVTDRLPPAWPFRETGLVLPSLIGPERQQLILATAERALDAVGARKGVFHVEIKTKSPVPEIIELNGRLGGFLARLVRYGTGERLGRLALSCLLGHAQDLTLRWDRCALSLNFQAPPTAVAVTSAPTRREIRRLPGVVAVDGVSPEGTAVDWRKGTIGAVAWVWLTGDGHDELHERLVDAGKVPVRPLHLRRCGRPRGTGFRMAGESVQVTCPGEHVMTPDDVAILMQDLLDSDEVAVDDSFFDIGGTSMNALTLISEVQRLSGVSLSLIDIVRNPTPDGIARLITQHRKEAAPARPDAAGAARQ